MHIPVGFAELAVIVPISFIVQMLPVSMNGFGVREATFAFYFTRLGLPLESALLVSFVGAALIMLFSLSGGLSSTWRGSENSPPAQLDAQRSRSHNAPVGRLCERHGKSLKYLTIAGKCPTLETPDSGSPAVPTSLQFSSCLADSVSAHGCVAGALPCGQLVTYRG